MNRMRQETEGSHDGAVHRSGRPQHHVGLVAEAYDNEHLQHSRPLAVAAPFDPESSRAPPGGLDLPASRDPLELREERPCASRAAATPV